jgi:hypothetical protein
VLAGDACSKPPITIRPHNLHACNIRGVVGGSVLILFFNMF